ncbi:MAG: HD-GYP domain-containing protein [Limnochordales bacterium]|nr:HD-GYP domain-containing protein [Limnochordales bacterium]
MLVGLVDVDSQGRIRLISEQEISLSEDLPLTAVAMGKIPYHADLRAKAAAIVPLRDYQGKIVGVITADRGLVSSNRTRGADLLWALLFLGAAAGTLLLWGVDLEVQPELPPLGTGSSPGLMPEGSPSLNDHDVSMEHLIHAVTAVLELRDIETAGHTERVADLAIAIGVKMGLSKWQLLTLRRVAFLHDVGKIAIPDSILRKPGPLDSEEWAVMKKHPVASYLVASGLPRISEDALLGIIQHHERWDGTGYPFGLRQDNIHWAARTFAVADSFDAMTSERVYKPAKSLAAAREEISSLAGSQYDPAVVEAFLRLPIDFLDDWRNQPRLTPLSGALAHLFANLPGQEKPGK